MLRTLGRNGVVERSIATRRHIPSVKGRYGSVALRPLPSTLTHTRLLATSTPQTKTDPSSLKTPSSVPPEPKGSTPRKPKVDLKPAPVKPPITKATSTTIVPKSQAARNSLVDEPKPRPSSQHVNSVPASTSASPSAAATTPSSSIPTISKAVSEAKLDIQKAEEQGVLAPPPANAGRIRRLLHHGKEIFKFYWNGLKMINTHRVQVAQIKLRLKEGREPISRAEYRFMRTHNEDILKLVPFLLVVLILEELIPLIVIYVPGMLPSTTIFPSQLKRIEEKAREKQLAFAARRAVFATIVQAGKNNGKMVDLKQLVALEGGATKTVCGVLRQATWGPAAIQRWRIDRHLKHVARDDELLVKEDLGMRLADGEVGRALYERGIIATKLTHEQARKKTPDVAYERVRVGQGAGG